MPVSAIPFACPSHTHNGCCSSQPSHLYFTSEMANVKSQKKKSSIPTWMNPFRIALLETPKQQFLLVSQQPTIFALEVGKCRFLLRFTASIRSEGRREWVLIKSTRGSERLKKLTQVHSQLSGRLDIHPNLKPLLAATTLYHALSKPKALWDSGPNWKRFGEGVASQGLLLGSVASALGFQGILGLWALKEAAKPTEPLMCAQTTHFLNKY